MNKFFYALLTLSAVLPSLIAAEEDAARQNHPATSYAYYVSAIWEMGSDICKRAATVNTQLCEKWFTDKKSENMKEKWQSARNSLPEDSRMWPLLREVRATYDSCVELATFPGSVSVIGYRSKLLDCDDKVKKAVVNLNIELEDL